jgi:peptidyl-prolyl cis-trans isomerase-like 3
VQQQEQPTHVLKHQQIPQQEPTNPKPKTQTQTMSLTLHTTIGDIKLEIYCDTCPRTAFNFLALAASGAYDNTIFHRNIKGFMIQGGSTEDKTGVKGGESIWGDTSFPDEFHPQNKHDKRGVLSMANKGPNTNRSQFFLLYNAQPHLDNHHTVFGRMLDGWDVLDKMENLPVLGATAPKKKLENCPVTPPVLQRITIHANPLADEMIVYPTHDGPPEKRL